MVGVALAHASPALAILPYEIQPQELVLLPEYCQAAGGIKPIGDWREKLAPVWDHIHHACHGYKFLLRSAKPLLSKQEKLFYLQSALDEFRYVAEKCPPNFWFCRELHMQKGIAYSRMGRTKEAAEEYYIASKYPLTP
ncbi:MAG TPA: hypothetical protein VFB54_17495 [Burkholderiales bacterium]|nr:hypothetical protein [Burkholderiales bacterium]